MTAFFLRVLLIALAVLLVIALIRALVRRLWPIRIGQPSSRRAYLLTKLDGGIAKARSVAWSCVAIIALVVLAKMAVHRLASDEPAKPEPEPAQVR